jgi:hypothetical protein
MSEARPPSQPGLHRLPAPPFQRAVPITPADRTGARVDCFPIHAAFPEIQAGRHPHHHFRGLLRLHSRYGPLDCSTAQGGLCHEASTRPVTQPGRSSATGTIDNSPGEIFLHWWCVPSARTEFSGLAPLSIITCIITSLIRQAIVTLQYNQDTAIRAPRSRGRQRMIPLRSADRTDYRGCKPPRPQHDQPLRGSVKPIHAATIFRHNGARPAPLGCLDR